MRLLDLRKVVYTVTILVVATNGFAAFLLWFFFRQLRSPIVSFPTDGIPGGFYYTVIPLLFVFLELLVVILIYWPFGPQLGPQWPTGPQNRSLLRLTFAGAGSGLGLLILFVPLLLRTKPDTGLVSLVLYYSRTSPIFTYIAVALIGIVLPVVAETVFKGIVLKTLLKHMSLLWSLLITSVAFALIWPVFQGYWLALGLGAVTCLLYYRYRLLLPPMIAHITFTCTVFGFLAFRVLMLH